MSIRMGRVSRNNPEMLPIPARVQGYGEYPEKLRVSFANGRTKVYEMYVKQPKPTFFSDAEMKRMKKTEGSYQYRGKRK